MISRRCFSLFAAVLVSATALVAPAAGQDFRGSIAGTVTDSTGGVLPGVTITVANTETGVSQHVVTESNGLYQVFYLNAGTYSVTAELSGFKRVARPDNVVRVGDVSRVDITMETGVIEETVTVTAEATPSCAPPRASRRWMRRVVDADRFGALHGRCDRHTAHARSVERTYS